VSGPAGRGSADSVLVSGRALRSWAPVDARG
jgi:hypothetical protein